MRAADQQKGFTLAELLIVIAIIAILLGVLLSAINAAREAARRAQCISKMKQITTAIANYENAHGSLPPAVPSGTTKAWHSAGAESQNFCVGPVWSGQILGFMGEVNMFDRLGHCMEVEYQACDDCEQASGTHRITRAKLIFSVGDETPDFMRCPSAPEPQKIFETSKVSLENLSKGNYAACLGSSIYLHSIDGNKYVDDRLKNETFRDPVPGMSPGDEIDYSLAVRSRGAITVTMIPDWEHKVRQQRSQNGAESFGMWIFAFGRGVKPSKIADGASKTIVVSEVLTIDGSAGGNSRFSEDIRGVWMCSSMGASTYSHLTSPNSPVIDNINACETNIPDDSPLTCKEIPATGNTAGDTFASARSQHPGGVVAGRADASAGFHADVIDLKIWRALATRAGQDQKDEN